MTANSVTTATSWQTAHDALQSLLEQLDNAADAATDKAAIDAIDNQADKIDDALTALNQIDMKSRTVAIQAAAADLTLALKQLETLKEELEKIAKDVEKVSTVLGDIDKAVTQIRSCFSI